MKSGKVNNNAFTKRKDSDDEDSSGSPVAQKASAKNINGKSNNNIFAKRKASEESDTG